VLLFRETSDHEEIAGQRALRNRVMLPVLADGSGSAVSVGKRVRGPSRPCECCAALSTDIICPHLSRGECEMTWKTPKIIELAVGLEINMYACAVRK
jgi:coenzyme PQQ precursor peptide PqqA